MLLFFGQMFSILFASCYLLNACVTTIILTSCKQYPKEYVIIKPQNLADHSSLSMYTLQTSPNYYYIPLKYQLTDTA